MTRVFTIQPRKGDGAQLKVHVPEDEWQLSAGRAASARVFMIHDYGRAKLQGRPFDIISEVLEPDQLPVHLQIGSEVTWHSPECPDTATGTIASVAVMDDDRVRVVFEDGFIFETSRTEFTSPEMRAAVSAYLDILAGNANGDLGSLWRKYGRKNVEAAIARDIKPRKTRRPYSLE